LAKLGHAILSEATQEAVSHARGTAYPCNQFGNQEPGDYDDVCKFARDQYGAKFSIFDKVL